MNSCLKRYIHMHSLHSVVRTTTDIYGCAGTVTIVPKGTTGTIVHIYKDGEAYAVEFNIPPRDCEVLTVYENQITSVTTPFRADCSTPNRIDYKP